MQIDLYRLYFPSGFILGLWGALVWVLYSAHLINYPGALHPEIMMGGFLLSFVVGFLCTAVPKFTDSFPPTKNELIASGVLIIALFAAQLSANFFYFRICSFSLFVFLAFFIIRRFLQRKVNPPPPFVFIGFGVLSGLVGSLILLLSHTNGISSNFYNLGRIFLIQTYILSFVLGIGSRLIPSLLGFAPPPNQIQKSISIKTYFILGCIFFITYFVEVFVSALIGMLLRDFIIIFIAFVPWKILNLPKRKAIHAYGLWLSCWFLLIGHVGASFFLQYKIHFMHLFYIGGLSLMTLLVASRVTLSHGGHDMKPEIKSKTLIGLVFIFTLAALTRFSAGLFPQLYLSHLLYASLVWIFGLLLWGGKFIPKIIKIKK
ncbi:MAG: NnrS family protein [Bdellovibrionales bacterium]|nr:NnrS family protein [Bdellovibrionales bacterium]